MCLRPVWPRTLSPCLRRLNHLITSRALTIFLLMCHGEKGVTTEGRRLSISEQTTPHTLLEALSDYRGVKQRDSQEPRAPSRQLHGERCHDSHHGFYHRPLCPSPSTAPLQLGGHNSPYPRQRICTNCPAPPQIFSSAATPASKTALVSKAKNEARDI